MAEPDVYYCDDYEALTGRERDGSIRGEGEDAVASSVETKVVSAPEPTASKPSAVAETA